MINKFENDFNLFREDYIKLSKEPFQFLSCFLSYYNHLKYNKEIKIPILFDATCSGIQHLSALTKDIKIAGLVNILNNDEPSDFYQYCINQIVEVINSLPKEIDGIADNNFKEKLLNLKLSRKLLKHSIMTIPYNVSSSSMIDYIKQEFTYTEGKYILK